MSEKDFLKLSAVLARLEAANNDTELIRVAHRSIPELRRHVRGLVEFKGRRFDFNTSNTLANHLHGLFVEWACHHPKLLPQSLTNHLGLFKCMDFQPFQRLPLELRRKVWRYTIDSAEPNGRVLEIFNATRGLLDMETGSWKRPERAPQWKMAIYDRGSVPNLLRTCHDSHQVVLEAFQSKGNFASVEARLSQVVISSDEDTLFLTDDCFRYPNWRYRYCLYDSEFLESLTRVQSIAFSVFIFENNSLGQRSRSFFLEKLAALETLEEIILVLHTAESERPDTLGKGHITSLQFIPLHTLSGNISERMQDKFEEWKAAIQGFANLRNIKLGIVQAIRPASQKPSIITTFTANETGPNVIDSKFTVLNPGAQEPEPVQETKNSSYS